MTVPMNPAAIAHALAAIVVIAVSIPLLQGKVRMNEWYGFRISAAFASDEAWYAINRYGARLFLIWGAVIALTAGVGMFLEKRYWIAYN
jgi:hypothetical protein